MELTELKWRGTLAPTMGWAIGTKALALDEARATMAMDVAAAVVEEGGDIVIELVRGSAFEPWSVGLLR